MSHSTKMIDQAVKTVSAENGKYLTFTLKDEEYGIEILRVKEIIGMMPITPVPGTPDYIKGVINLRGKVIPVMDLRLKFSMEESSYDERTCIIVIEIDLEQEIILVGIVVDSVSEVLNIRTKDIEEPPAFGTKSDTGYVLGLAKIDSLVKILLNIDKILSSDELEIFKNTS